MVSSTAWRAGESAAPGVSVVTTGSGIADRSGAALCCGAAGVREGVVRTELLISGMRDNACRERVADALRRVEGVVDVSVSLLRARAIVLHTASCDKEWLVRAVSAAGYQSTL